MQSKYYIQITRIGETLEELKEHYDIDLAFNKKIEVRKEFYDDCRNSIVSFIYPNHETSESQIPDLKKYFTCPVSVEMLEGQRIIKKEDGQLNIEAVLFCKMGVVPF